MIVIADTCSLHRLVEYYLPFDKSKKLYELIASCFANRELLITDAVYQECRWMSKGKIIKGLPFLSDKSGISATRSILPSKKLLRMVDNQFTIRTRFNVLDVGEREAQKESYLNGGDFSIIQFAYNEMKSLDGNLFNMDARVLTDETSVENDNKCFKKIPSCCKILGISTINIREYLEILTDGNIELVIRR